MNIQINVRYRQPEYGRGWKKFFYLYGIASFAVSVFELLIDCIFYYL